VFPAAAICPMFNVLGGNKEEGVCKKKKKGGGVESCDMSAVKILDSVVAFPISERTIKDRVDHFKCEH
jgi:hypothetical protein